MSKKILLPYDPIPPDFPKILANENVIWIPFHVPSSKNGKIKTRWGLVNSKFVRQYISISEEHYAQNKDKFLALIEGKPLPIKIGFHFLRKTRHKYDFVNPVQTVQDIMQKQDWIGNDDIDTIVPFPFTIFKKYTHVVPKEQSGVFIWVMQ